MAQPKLNQDLLLVRLQVVAYVCVLFFSRINFPCSLVGCMRKEKARSFRVSGW